MTFDKRFYTAALFAAGALALALPSGYSFGFYAMCLTALVVWFKNREPLVVLDSKYLIYPLLAYSLVHLGLAWHEKLAARYFSDYLPFLLLPFGMLGLRKSKPNANWFWLGLAVGAMGAAALSGYQSIHLGIRAGGYSHPIQFGNIALLFGVLCLVRVTMEWQLTWLNVVLVAGAVSGLAASVFSQTRGGWLALVLILGWAFARTTQSWPQPKRWGLAAVLAVILALPVLQPNGIVQQRVGVAVAEWNDYFDTGKQDSSVGARLAMWKVGLEGIVKAPLLGQGNQGWLDTRDAALASGELSAFSAGFTHLHNEYLNVAFKRGLVGLSFYLAMYLVPMFYFFKPYLHDENAEVRALSIAGMVVPMMYMDFALTQSFLTHNSGRVVLCSLWMCVAALLMNTVQSKSECVNG